MDGLLLLLKHNKFKTKLESSFIVYCSISSLHAAVNVISLVVSKPIFGLQHFVNLEGEMRVVTLNQIWLLFLHMRFPFQLFSQIEHWDEVQYFYQSYQF